MPADETRMPIGRFAASVRLSVKALRHYDELGLLRPAVVDPRTGYRYYARSQARDAVMIAMLRELELPLAVVREALAATPEELKPLLDREARRLERELAQRGRALRSLQRIARAGRLAPYVVQVRREAPLAVARLTIETTPEALVPESTAAVYRLLDALRGAGWVECGPVLCVNEAPDDEGRQRVHACAAVEAGFAPPRGIERATLPGGDVAWLVHEGPFEELGLAHHALHAWVQEQGHAATGPVREIYRNDPAEVAEEALLTEVCLPI
ncbi:MAG TPA: MerR family transcriptional regulator [Myxococcota bacterium]|nr:MerR family transcriptional regulator [Myxococcota bacterium]